MKYRDPNTGTFKDLKIKVSDTIAIGAIIEWTTDTAPDGWLICDGSAISRTVYALLFAVIGTTYGDGDGETTFNLPDIETNSIIKATQIIAPPVNKNIITALMKQTSETGNVYSLPATDYQKLPLDESVSIGDKFTLQNHEIKVGSDIHHIKISAQVSFQNLSAGVKFVSIFQNDNAVTTSVANLSTRSMLNNTDFLLEVSENDIISLQISGTQNDQIRRKGYTFITVEAVD